MKIYVYNHTIPSLTEARSVPTRMIFVNAKCCVQWLVQHRKRFRDEKIDESLQVYEMTNGSTARACARAMATLGTNVFVHDSVGYSPEPEQVEYLVDTEAISEWMKVNR